jgi:hypothetical protein
MSQRFGATESAELGLPALLDRKRRHLGSKIKRVREVCALPDGEWIARTPETWAHSPAAFRWGRLLLHGTVLDRDGAIAALGPPTSDMPTP